MKSLRLLSIHLFYISVSLIPFPCIIQAANEVKTTLSQTQTPHETHVIKFANNHLTVNVIDFSLAALLHEIARQSGLNLWCNITPDERISINFNQIPLDEGLREILRQYNVALEYCQHIDEKHQSPVLQPITLWVFLKGEKSYLVNTEYEKFEHTDTSLDYKADDMIRLSEKFREMVINEFEQIGTTRRFETEDVIRLDEKTMEMLFNESRNP
jgi:type II secretory pathway component GspD/PulD (secretin)